MLTAHFCCQAEVARIASITQLPDQGRTILNLKTPLAYAHYAGAEQTYGTFNMRIRARVGLLSRNIVIQGEGQGEEVPYTSWNYPDPLLVSIIGNRVFLILMTTFTLVISVQVNMGTYVYMWISV
jgi:hypothetical protein